MPTLDQTSQRWEKAWLALQVMVLGLVSASPLVADSIPEQCSNWLLIVLWLIVFIAFFAFRFSPLNTIVRWNIYDVGVLAIVGLAILSGIYSVSVHGGHGRPVINACWQWCSLGIAYFLLRNLCSDARFRQAALLTLCLLATGLSAAGTYQRYIIIPAVQSEYESQTEEQKQIELQKLGIANTEKGSPDRVRFESRLFGTEVTGTFLLANSLGAFLVPWTIFIFGYAINNFRHDPKQFMVVAFALTLLVICLILTKSRTALLVVLIGVCIKLLFQNNSAWSSVVCRATYIVMGMFVVFYLPASFFLLDVEAFKEAPKSVLYRLEYWQATREMIIDHLLMGVGPGNFQQVYAQYQLPQASETVADPHNFLFEVWATAGTPAALLSITLCGITTYLTVFRWTGNDLPEGNSLAGNEQQDPEDLDQADRVKLLQLISGGLIAGVLLGIFVAFVNSFDLRPMFISGVVSAGFVLAFYYTSSKSNFSWINRIDWIVPFALCSYFLALTASGGIGIPGVAMTGILLLACFSSQFPLREIHFSKAAAIIAIVGVTSLLFLIRISLIGPIQKSSQLESDAQYAMQSGDLEKALDQLDAASNADPFNGNFRFNSARLRFHLAVSQPTDKRWKEWLESAEQAVLARPNSSKVALEIGSCFLAFSIKSELPLSSDQKRQAASLAIDYLEKAVARRPNDAEHVAHLAYGFHKTGDFEKANRWAKKAIEINDQNPHSERDLGKLHFHLPGIIDNRDQEESIEQFLLNIRND